MLSIKVKPFTIFTGNSGTGKTKISQLFAQYLLNFEENKVLLNKKDSSNDYGYLTLKLDINKSVCKNSSFPIFNDYFARYSPFQQIEGSYDIFIDNKKAKARISLFNTLSFQDENFKKYICQLYNEGKHNITVKIKKEELKRYFSDNYIEAPDIIEFKLNLRKKPYHLPDHVFNYLPINSKGMSCSIIFHNENIKALLSPYLLFQIKVGNNKQFKNYLKTRRRTSSVKLLIGKKFNFKNFRSNRNLSTKSLDKTHLKNNFNYKIIPVGANWTENRHIVGYYNVITNEYQSTPAYDLIKAANNSAEPYFLILDEMNLSHVERYFADFLSAIESGEKIPLYGEKELTLPENLFIIGTVNVDETTYMFSPKVLDRANVIEFETYSASDYMNDNINLSSPSGNIEYLENPLAGNEIRSYGIDELREIFSDVTVDDEPFWDVLSYEISSFQTILSKSGFDFGFRVINEIVRFMAVAWEYEGKPSEFANWTRYFDACIKQKMLPKLHGSEKIIGETLEELSNLCSDSVIGTEDMVKYPESFKKLEEMKKILRKQRYVSFIN